MLRLSQFTGVNAIAYYAPTIYESSLGFPAVEAGTLAPASQACIILGGIICSFTVDRDDVQCGRNVYVLCLRYWSRIVGQPCSLESSCVLPVRRPPLNNKMKSH